MLAKPPWALPANAAPSKKHACEAAMVQWAGDELDKRNLEAVRRANIEAITGKFLKIAELNADCGHYELMRELDPQRAKYFNPPKLGRGQKFKKPKQWGLVDFAAEDVRYIKKRWPFGRTPRGQLSAVDIIVRLYRQRGEPVTAKAIKARMKPSGKHKRPR
jgi:hypothetical protein